jgi:hypothetical protein
MVPNARIRLCGDRRDEQTSSQVKIDEQGSGHPNFSLSKHPPTPMLPGTDRHSQVREVLKNQNFS